MHVGNRAVLPKSPPKGRTSQARMRYPKVAGADIYVTRLACGPANIPKLYRPIPQTRPGLNTAAPVTGSLHDELSCTMPLSDNPALSAVDTSPSRHPTESRPCYRCVRYMHSVGIKRVFWTNSEGSWECAKVRDLVDMVDGSGNDSDGVTGLGVFVTKHEVLRLRELFGA